MTAPATEYKGWHKFAPLGDSLAGGRVTRLPVRYALPKGRRMSVVAASLYRNGKLVGRSRSISRFLRGLPLRIHLGRTFEPSESELRRLQENYDLHPLAIEDALAAHQLPIPISEGVTWLELPNWLGSNSRWRTEEVRHAHCASGRL